MIRDNLSLNDRLIFACDYDNVAEAMKGVYHLRDVISTVKIGIQMFTKFGPQVVVGMRSQGFKVWLDLKYMDIPNTVKGAVQAAQMMGVDMLTIHLLGGEAMIKSAVDISNQLDPAKPLILGVSILTSLDEDDLMALGIRYDPLHAVRNLVWLGNQCGIHGVICSPNEVEKLRSIHSDLFIITPGIRLSSDLQDQKRVSTPGNAIMNGADAIVVGRPIKHADNKADVCNIILNEIQNSINLRSK